MGDSELDRLSTQLEVDVAVGDTFLHTIVDENVKHPRVSLYKNLGRAVDQERRWRQELEAIRRKTKRSGTFDLNRNLHLLEVDRPISEVEEALTNSHPWVSKPSNYRGTSWRSFSKRLMLAEWLLFMPETFATDYRMKLCPKGRHVLVFAAKGITRVLSRTGGLIMKTASRLPGGGLGQSEHQNAIYCSMLDCIMVSEQVDSMQLSDTMTCVPRQSSPIEFKVLDLIRFRGTSYTQLPFRERCLWLEKFLRDQIEEAADDDPVRFEVLPAYDCDAETMTSVFSIKPHFELDGILFYHEAVIYETGATPLVGWLKPYMLPEWFPHLNFHPDYMRDIPTDYTTYLNEVQKQEKQARGSGDRTPSALVVGNDQSG
ncbi:hypothetical protein EG68_04376 [Paragonimus skrjabini miyazakii]|uniref:Snurportin-1 n=1 Tax=Paragonimus skrjabini miyazakii TaxID=59628 RepID=A0A8S9Z515_9TREM|nr:hypothetical protein EG68_04376 [Paragonimus skrjabini miyazakii]